MSRKYNSQTAEQAAIAGSGDEREDLDADLVQLCAFHVGKESYVLDIMRIREIINPLEITAVRRSSAIVEGVIDLRGDVIPVVDLRRLLGVEVADATRATKQVIVSVGRGLVGLVVDSMGRVLVVPRSQIQPLPSLDTREQRLFPGVVNFQGRLHLLLNLKSLLEEEGLSSELLSKIQKRALVERG